ncbi:lytic transglycosylase domain-containing protein [Desulfobacterales bacterium HSG2]|nr:lytic transglycosylase domain-containing protein [Desulfobacterales bacterium HSG2]
MKKSIFLVFVLVMVFSIEAFGGSAHKFRANLRKELHPKEFKYYDIVKAASTKYKVDVSWLMAIIKAESNFNHRAVSPKGAIGLMQLMPKTARWLGINDPSDPRKNIHAGAKYISRLIKTFGRMDLALAAYNAGPTLVKKLRRVPRFRQTLIYVSRVLDYQEKYALAISAAAGASNKRGKKDI